jgi:hypothetical protein
LRAHVGALLRSAAPTVQNGGASLIGGSESFGLATISTSISWPLFGALHPLAHLELDRRASGDAADPQVLGPVTG